jgi:hypothetical protein
MRACRQISICVCKSFRCGNMGGHASGRPFSCQQSLDLCITCRDKIFSLVIPDTSPFGRLSTHVNKYPQNERGNELSTGKATVKRMHIF